EHSTPEEHHLRVESALLKLDFMRTGKHARIPLFLKRLQRYVNLYFEHEAWRYQHEERAVVNRGKNVDPRDSRHNAILFQLNVEAEKTLQRFWRSYLTRDRSTHLAFGLPLFTRQQAEILIRRLSDNDERQALERYPGEKVCWP